MRAIKDVARLVPRGARQFATHGYEHDIEQASIEHSLANLRTFPWIRLRENRKELSLHGAWFDISLGELHFYDSAECRLARSLGIARNGFASLKRFSTLAVMRETLLS